MASILDCWDIFWARDDQQPPAQAWKIWLLLGGRGSGKTRAGAEWIRQCVENKTAGQIALVAPTIGDVREVMIDGPSGLCHIGNPAERPEYIATRRRLEWPNGAIGHVYSAEDPDSLRGPQFDAAWADEFCAWSYPEDTLANLRLCLRLGDDPRLVMTTTPRPTKAMAGLIKTPALVITRSTSADNAKYLSEGFIEALQQTYGQGRLARQELGGELLFDRAGAMFSRDTLQQALCDVAPKLDMIIVAVDPPAASHAKANKCGIIIAGRTGQGPDCRAYILADKTVQGLAPEGWARHVIQAAEEFNTQIIIAETNQGGDMVRAVLQSAGCILPIKPVFAKRSKTARAEPVALLYTQGRVKHMGAFPELEDELCALGTESSQSPDRADALVWAVSYLLLGSSQRPRARTL